MNPPPVLNHPVRQDEEHLKLLAVFHFVLGGFALLGLAFIGLHYLIMNQVFTNPEMWRNAKGGPPPRELMRVFFWMYLFFAVVLVAIGVLNVMSGVFMRQRKHRMFSMVVAGIDCLQIPLGTALGVFTFIVLQRPSVRDAYDVASRLPQ